MTSTAQVCALCEGTGFVHIPNTTSARSCECRIRGMALLCRQKAGIPPAYLHATFDNFAPEVTIPGQAVALEAMKAFAANWEEHRQMGDFAAILGSTRRGKSHLAAATGRAIIDRIQKSVEEDIVMFINLSEWVMARKDHWGRWPVSMPDERKYGDPEWEESNARIARTDKRMRTVPLLIADDLGESRPEPSLLNKLYVIVEHRTANNLPMIVTSNHSWATVVARYGDDAHRIVDRIRERSVDRTFDFGTDEDKKKSGKGSKKK